jgi:elongation factor Ts
MDIIQIKQLRDQTGASVSDCKECLEMAKGDFNKAVELLRKKGAEIARKKSGRETTEGTIGSYLHSNGKLASFVVVKCETDFVAKNDEFQNLARDLAMQVAAMNPLYTSPSDVPDEVNEKEKEIEREKLQKEGKPQGMIEQILQGKLEKFYSQVCLLNQPFIKENKKTIQEIIREKVLKLGENIDVREFVRLEL